MNWAPFLLMMMSLFCIYSMAATDEDNDHRIVGGSDATLGEFPYQGLLKIATLICGCSIVNSKWAVTAAHCTYNQNVSDMKVTLGLINQNPGNGVSYFVRNTFHHPLYVPTAHAHDISLLQLSGEVLFSSGLISPIQLPAQGEQQKVGELCTITGWGLLQENFSVASQTLQKADVPILSNSECNEWYSTLLNLSSIVDSNQVCAGYQKGGVDTCQGDSGGPLACPSSSGSVLQGVTSFGYGCARPGQPGVYVRVSMYVDWIEDTISKNGAAQNRFCLWLIAVLCSISFLF